MFTINEVSKKTKLTARTIRHYEDKGLLQSSYRGANGYRYFDESAVLRLEEIKKLKEMEFSLNEIKSFLKLKEDNLEDSLTSRLSDKLVSIDSEIARLMRSKQEVQDQLLATKKFFNKETLSKGQRRVLMETIKQDILSKLKKRKEVSRRDLEYLKREDYLFDSVEKREFLGAVKKCLDFAEKEGIRLGPARGAAPALLSMYALGWSNFDPSEMDLIPERFSITDFELHIDVEFQNGKKFIDFCRSISSELRLGKIEAFKLPILDIIENVHSRIGKSINYDLIDINDPMILDLFRSGDIEKIFSFDFPKQTLMAKHYDDYYYKEGKATEMLSEYLRSQKIYSFQDVLNIEAIFRPDNLSKHSFMKEYIERYPKAKLEPFSYDCLSSTLNEYLKPNFGVIIYQEDIIEIIREYTQWDYTKCNMVRKALSLGNISNDQLDDLRDNMPEDVVNLLLKESPVVFCKAHSVGAWPELIKKTVVLKALHKDIYFEEIEKWEAENAYSWGDFGFISGEVSLLQQ